MHLNKDHRNPDVGELFERTEVTSEVEDFLPMVPGEIEKQLNMLTGSLPEKNIGPQCFDPRDCPFMDRCWPDGRNHIRNLYNVGPKKTCAYLRQGVETIDELPPDTKLPPAARR